MRIDRAALALVRGLFREPRAPLVALASHRFDALRRRFAERGRRFRAQRLEQLLEDQNTVALEAHVRGEAPDGEAFLHDVHVDVRPPGMRILLRVRGDPRHIHVDEQPHVGLGDGGHHSGEAG